MSADSVTPGVVTDAPRRRFDERVGKAGLALVYAGIGLDLICGVVIWVTLRAAFGLGWTPFST